MHFLVRFYMPGVCGEKDELPLPYFQQLLRESMAENRKLCQAPQWYILKLWWYFLDKTIDAIEEKPVVLLTSVWLSISIFGTICSNSTSFCTLRLQDNQDPKYYVILFTMYIFHLHFKNCYTAPDNEFIIIMLFFIMFG